MKNLLIVLSGGMDSVTMLYERKDTIALAITFDYGANHNAKEIAFAKEHCKQLGIEHIIIPLDFIHKYFKSSLLGGAKAIPEGHFTAEDMKSTVVPFRNGIMLAIACGMAESRRLKGILTANHTGDHAIFPDCRPEFVQAFSRACKFGTSTHVNFLAPYTNITKGQIAQIGKHLNLDYSRTWSCYRGEKIHCGKCATCVERKEALAFAGIKDPTKYEF